MKVYLWSKGLTEAFIQIKHGNPYFHYHLDKRKFFAKKMKYAYQEWPHPAYTASPHSQKVERKREHGIIIISFKMDATNK